MGKKAKAQVTQFDKLKTKAEKTAGKWTEFFQSLEFQIGFLIFLLIWLGFLVWFILKIRRMTINYESDQLRDSPVEFFNYTFNRLIKELTAQSQDDSITTRLLERIGRLGQLENFSKLFNEYAIKTNAVVEIIKDAEERSAYCNYGDNDHYISTLLNYTGVILNSSQGAIPYCNAQPLPKILNGCIGSANVLSFAKDLINAMIKSSDASCPIKISKSLVKMLSDETKAQQVDQLTQYFIERPDMFIRSSPDICSFISSYTNKQHLWTRDTGKIFCKANKMFKCESVPELEQYCVDDSEEL